MKRSPHQLTDSDHDAYYLHGENHDALMAAANQIFARCPDMPHLRVDVDGLGEIAQQWGNPSLFGPSGCVALVRNADAARGKQIDHLLGLAGRVPAGSCLILCAGGAMWKKALHKKLIAIPQLAHCEFHPPNEAEFLRWLQAEAKARSLNLVPEVVQRASERLCGMQQAASQWLERLQWYNEDPSTPISWSIAADLLGEKAPQELESWCHALAMRDATALRLQRRLVREQRVSEVQMVRWIGIRMQQIVLYRWHQAAHTPNPIAASKVFGEARKLIAREADQWPAPLLSNLLSRIRHAEALLKGASPQSKEVVLEQLSCDLLRGRLE
ncbi:MAG: hypothetical protein R8J84_09100 [Mariprofundales bacterium]